MMAPLDQKYRLLCAAVVTAVVVYSILFATLRIKGDIENNNPIETYVKTSLGWDMGVNTSSTYETKNFIVYTPGCKIPKLDPLHTTVKHFIKHLPDLECGLPSFVIVENNTLKLDKNTIPKNVDCFIRTITRKDDDSVTLGPAVPFENGSKGVNLEFVTVECKTDGATVYRQFYPFVFPKESVEKRIQKYRETQNPAQNNNLKILLLGLDSVSKNQFLRHMSKTQQFIREKLNYIEIHGYNKIGKNTYSNVLPMLTGRLESESPDISVQAAEVLPIIWKEYMENGYKTLYSENLPFGSAFNYGRKGFTDPPVDYYLRPWSIAVEPYIKTWKTGCLNERIETNVILKYVGDLFDLFPNDPLFAFSFFTRMSHDYINQLRYEDKPVHDFLERLFLNGHLNNTIVFLFGDHGFRFGDIRSTYVGRMEGRLPLMFIIVPPWFPEKYPQMYKNLKTNEKRLTTPLDIYATLKDLLDFDGKGFEVEGTGRNISLLKHPIPANRTCPDASIQSQWCSCVTSDPVPLNDARVRKSASEIVRKINSITEDYRENCASLSLVSILSASEQEVGIGEDATHDGYTNFLITLKVSPSDGIFEGSVWFDGKKSYSVDNTIERLNLYGNQSVCVDRHVLKSYCYCTV